MPLFAILALVMLLAPSVALADDPAITLSLRDAIRMAAEKNLDVRAELYNPAQYEADVNRYRGIYDPLFSMNGAYSDTTAPNAVPADRSSAGYDRTYQINSSISQLFWTGGTASLFYNNQYTATNSFAIPSRYWQSGAGVSFTQPLLKNRGRENTEVNITVSRLSKSASLERFTARLLNTVAQVRTEYFKLYNLREQLEVRKISLELARKILAETRSRVATGVLPAMEILNAEFGVTSREKDLIDTEKAVRDQVDLLRQLLQLEHQGDIIPADIPRRDQFQTDEADAIKRALADRPDIREQRRNLEIAELQTRISGNNVQPDLSLVSSVTLAGLDHNYAATMDRVGSLDYPAWNVGLNFSYPFGNNAAGNDYRKNRLKTEQTALQIKSLEEGVVKDVRAAVRAVTTGYKQLDVTERGRAYAEERLRAFIRKNEVGLATVKDVMDVENDLATAKSNQIAAQVNYDNAITTLWLVTGELLDREGILVREGDADQLYKAVR